MLLPDRSSAGVYSMENDRSQQPQIVTNGYCTLVLPFPRGEENVNTLVTSPEEINRKFGDATGRYAVSVQIAKLLMTKATRLNITRAANNTRKSSVYLTLFDNTCVFRAGMQGGIKDIEDVPFNTRDIGVFASISGYAEADRIWLTVEPDFTDRMGIKSIVKVYEGDNLTPVEQHIVTTFYYRDGNGDQFFIEDVINNQSNLIRFRLNVDNFRLLEDPKFMLINAIAGGKYDPLNPTQPNGQMVGGSDGDIVDIYDPDPIISGRSLSLLLKGWDNYRDWEETEAGILCAGGQEHPVIANKINELAKSRMDCIACSAPPSTVQERDRAVAYRRGTKEFGGAVFSLIDSWSALTSSDVLARDNENSRNFWVPASVCMAYTMLNTDQIASWLAPAGLNRGQLPFALDVRHRYRQSDRDILNDNQINPIAVIKGEGIFVFGADTTQTTRSALNDIGVRRLLAMLHATVRSENLAAVFEPNDDVLKQRMVAGMEAVLEPIKLGRGLDWYEVRCDYSNNTAMDEARGDLIVDIFLDPTRYTKRIHVTAVVPPVGEIQYALELIQKGQL